MSSKSEFLWPDCKVCAVSLTYDDARPCHYQTVAPRLERCGLRATFYLTIIGRFLKETERWREVSRAGHELGNHTLFHPCRSLPDAEKKWLNPAYNLCDYNEKRLRDELSLANWILHRVDGRTERTYGNTCHENHIGFGDTKKRMEPILANYFIAARGEYRGSHIDMSRLNLLNLGTTKADGCTFEQLRDAIEQARENKSWIIFTAHSVDQKTTFSEYEHARLTEWLGARQDTIWTAPVADIASYIRQRCPDSMPRT